MSDRKQTPNILADLMGGADPAAQPTPVEALIQPPATSKRRAAAKPRGAQPASETAPAALFSPRWEHRLASFQEHNGWRLRYVDGQAVPDWATGLTLAEYVARMANDGWQVAAATSGAAMFGVLDKYQVFFKRQR